MNIHDTNLQEIIKRKNERTYNYNLKPPDSSIEIESAIQDGCGDFHEFQQEIGRSNWHVRRVSIEHHDVPSHMKRSGRMQSLQEFQQRVERDDSKSDEIDLVTENDHRYPLTSSHSSMSSHFGPNHRTTRTSRYYYRNQLKLISFLVLIGIIGGPLNYSIRKAYGLLLLLRLRLMDKVSSYVGRYFIWVTHTVIFSQIAILWTKIAPVASGSGVSQIKSVLTGIDPKMYLPGYFDFSTLIAKVGGLIFAVGSGLIIGTEGAFVHIMSIVTHHLLHSRIYSRFNERLHARLQLLAAACAVGVSSTFSTPIGGVLFSMEVTSTYYMMSNYVKAFVASVSGSLMLNLTLSIVNKQSQEMNSMILETGLPNEIYQMYELPLFGILGAVIGALSTAMIWLIRIIAAQRQSLRNSDDNFKHIFVRWIDPLLVAIIVASIEYLTGRLFRYGDSFEDLLELFIERNLPTPWLEISAYFSLTLLFVAYAALLPLCITLQIPTGVWFPTFIAGAAFGRLFGETMRNLIPSLQLHPGAYALVGAAAFAGASTRTVSAAVIAIEITGEVQLMLPIFCGVLTSMGMSALWKERSVYDTLLLANGLPYLPLLDFDTALTAKDIIEPLLVYLTKNTTISRLLLVIQRMPGQDIPLVQSEESMILLGVISESQIKRLIKCYYATHNLDSVEIDLGEEAKQPVSSFGLKTFVEMIGKRSIGGLNLRMSFDQVYSELSTEMMHGIQGGIPFMMDDDKMLNLLRQGWPIEKRQLLDKMINITYGNICHVKPLTMTISSTTPLENIHMIFTMLRCDHCFVCDQGELLGVVTTKALLRAGSHIETN